MLYIVLFFTFFSLFLYVLLGGADFGAGIVELFSSKENRKLNRDTIYEVMGPVWEANHIWLIILIVILWIAFPVYFNIIIIYLHIPLTLVLLGITMRGVAFIFRHYDAVEGASQIWYNRMFRVSSLITPIFLGMSFGSLVSGEIVITTDYAETSFAEVFMNSWLNMFSFLTGLFYAALCAFLASTLLIGETTGETRKLYSRKSAIYTVVVVLLGAALLMYGLVADVIFVQDFLSDIYSLSAVSLSALLLIPLWKAIKEQHSSLTRFYAGFQILLILFAAVNTHFPYLIITSTGEVNMMDDTAPDSVINVLGISLIIGGAIILPGLYHLMRSFSMIRIPENEGEEEENL
ncbi:cytochrome d ubiquinol oxidase subunit II [Christiangramia sabulilitoris]|uniref:Cytochrome d ubiquinol oxidase subunit II n=1 Tax=Christiangramia sabulilitoris TaxID=2583991 RepID=A0A550I711_9FLAO|nr:cytochrome d ubiquinol oxidase subunit II [Christiangramia sabulilitoris]TRO66764.1 cytochrome d ubiquinol oxidase subunit II [Christiangramia sabulilitoris]